MVLKKMSKKEANTCANVTAKLREWRKNESTDVLLGWRTIVEVG